MSTGQRIFDTMDDERFILEVENHKILYDSTGAMALLSGAIGAKRSASEMLQVGYDAVRRMEQHRVAAGM